jgi:hypothetical protein
MALGLLRALKGVAYHFQSQKYLSHALHESMKRYYNCTQGKFATTQAYLEHFQNMVDVVVHSGGEIAGHPGVRAAHLGRTRIWSKIALNSGTEDRSRHLEVTSRSTAMRLLAWDADRARYGKLIEDLENDFLQGHNNYPNDTSQPHTTCSPIGNKRTDTAGAHHRPMQCHLPMLMGARRRHATRHISHATRCSK